MRNAAIKEESGGKKAGSSITEEKYKKGHSTKSSPCKN